MITIHPAVLSVVGASALGALLWTSASRFVVGGTPGTGFEPTTMQGSVEADEDRSLAISVFASGPLLEPTSRDTIRVVSVHQSFESSADRRVLTRVDVFRHLDPLSSEPIRAKYTVSDVASGAAEMALFEVEVAPVLGKTWLDVQEFEDLVVTATRVQ